VSYDDVTVVMISMNEENSIAKVLSDIERDLPGAEVLLVDSSSDRTPEIAEQAGARVLRQFPPQGYGPAMERALMTPERGIVVTLVSLLLLLAATVFSVVVVGRFTGLAAFTFTAGWALVAIIVASSSVTVKIAAVLALLVIAAVLVIRTARSPRKAILLLG